MALHGTLDTFALGDVMQLLAVTAKSGCLQVESEDAAGRVWVDAGSVIGIEATVAGDRAEPAEVMFELLQVGSGAFEFVPGDAPDSPVGPLDVDALLAAASEIEAEWEKLRTNVPSLDVKARLSAALPTPTVEVTEAQWSALSAVVSADAVGNAGESMKLSQLGVARAVSGLVASGLIELGAPSPDSTPRRRVTRSAPPVGLDAKPARPTPPTPAAARSERPAPAAPPVRAPQVAEPTTAGVATPSALDDDDFGIRFDDPALAAEAPSTEEGPADRKLSSDEDLAGMSPKARAALDAMAAEPGAGKSEPVAQPEDKPTDQPDTNEAPERASLLRFLSSTKG